MQYQDGHLRFSPSDLVNYSRSAFISWMDRRATEDAGIKALKDTPSTMLSYLAEKGYEHEDAFLEILKREYENVVTVDVDNTTKAMQIEATLNAMRSGADVIFQARLSHGDFAGYADFLVKVPEPSDLGALGYEIS